MLIWEEINFRNYAKYSFAFVKPVSSLDFPALFSYRYYFIKLQALCHLGHGPILQF